MWQCILCGQAILPVDLKEVGKDAWVCRSARWCLIQRLHSATDTEIASLHAGALRMALDAQGVQLFLTENKTLPTST